MVILSWAVFGLLALFWTGAAWLSAEVTGWLAQLLASGSAVQAAGDVAALPVPAWARLWIDPAWVELLQSALGGAIGLAGSGGAAALAVAGWIVAAIWIGWGLGLALLVIGAVAAHLLLRRFASRRAVAA
jgi:hypothetical protein